MANVKHEQTKKKTAGTHPVQRIVNCSDLIISIQAEQGEKIFSCKIAFEENYFKVSKVRPSCHKMIDAMVRELIKKKLIST